MSRDTLPPGWALGKFEDILINPKADLVDGPFGSNLKSEEYVESGVPVLKIQNIKADRFVRKHFSYVTEKKAAELSRHSFIPGDLIITKLGDPLGLCCEVPKDFIPGVFVADLMRLRLLSNRLSKRFVLLAINSQVVQNQFKQITKGTTRPRVNLTIVRSLELPLPPLKEQKRIVTKIEELFSELEAGEESLRLARRKLGVYRQSLLKQAFEGKLTAKWRTQNPDKLESPAALLTQVESDRQIRYEQQLQEWKANLEDWDKGRPDEKRPCKPGKPKTIQLPTADQVADLPELPIEWSWTPLANCAVEISDGPFGSNLKSSDYVALGIRVVRLGNIGAGEFIEEDKSYISPEKYEKLKRHTVRPGDIVLASFITDVVRAALIPPSVEYAVNKADCFQVHCFSKTLCSEFLVRCFGARYFFKQLEQLVHGVGRPRINTTQLGEALVPICSLPEQQEIVRLLNERFEAIERNEREIDGALQKSEALRQSILKKAFSGQLVPQDPNDEPASELLARIQSRRKDAVKSHAGRHKKSA